MLRKISKTALILLALTLSMLILFTGLLMAAFLLPDERISENAHRSTNIIQYEYVSIPLPMFFHNYNASNITDNIMLI